MENSEETINIDLIRSTSANGSFTSEEEQKSSREDELEVTIRSLESKNISLLRDLFHLKDLLEKKMGVEQANEVFKLLDAKNAAEQCYSEQQQKLRELEARNQKLNELIAAANSSGPTKSTSAPLVYSTPPRKVRVVLGKNAKGSAVRSTSNKSLRPAKAAVQIVDLDTDGGEKTEETRGVRSGCWLAAFRTTLVLAFVAIFLLTFVHVYLFAYQLLNC